MGRTFLKYITEKHPELKAAYRELKKRTKDDPAIGPIGVGRKYSEHEGRFTDVSNETGNYVLSVTVDEKKTNNQLSESQHLPHRLLVSVPGKKRRVSVPIDVISLKRPKSQEEGFRGFQSSRPPTAENFQMGRLFSMSDGPEDQAGVNCDSYESGTVGGIFRVYLEDGSEETRLVSAGHVFAGIGYRHMPTYEFGIGHYKAKIRHIRRPSDLRPRDIVINEKYTDIASIRLPQAIADAKRPEYIDTILATKQDQVNALENKEESLMLVEGRSNLPTTLPMDVIGCYDGFSFPGREEQFTTGSFWLIRQVSENGRFSRPGDSGAAILIPSKSYEDRWRLLAFHFYQEVFDSNDPSEKLRRWIKTKGIYSLAVGADSALSNVLGSRKFDLI